jgi:6-phosphogluconolactonase (cycloisomerase 2 family)
MTRFATCITRFAALLSPVLFLTACGGGYTIDYLYSTNAHSSTTGGPGGVYSYSVNNQTGGLNTIASNTAAQVTPIAAVASPNQANLYVANQGSNTVQTFTINKSNGTLSGATSTKTAGTLPTAIAIDQANKFLFVTDTYAPGFSSSSPGPGDLDVYAINSNGSLGTPGSCGVGVAIPGGVGCYYTVGYSPMGVNVLVSEANVYVTNQGSSSITGFVLGTSGGLTAPSNTPAGVEPSAIASDPHSLFVYVTDYVQNQVFGFTIGTAGVLTPATWQAVPADKGPLGITIDPRGKYMYVSNYNSADISPYTLNMANGQPTAIATGTATGTYGVGAGPLCLGIEPVRGRYLYVANYFDPSIGGFRLNTSTGQLSAVQNQPFVTGSEVTCIAISGHGAVPVLGTP